MDPVTLSALLGGTALNIFGGILGRNDALANATAQAQASNAALEKNIGILNGYETTNQNTFNNNVANYTPDAQAKLLSDAQTTRGSNNVSNITQDTGAGAPIAAGSSPASRSDLAKRMLAVYDQATDRAKALGKLGGYSDAWTANNIGNQKAAEQIGVTNNLAEARKGLVQPESQLAALAATKQPSIWGPLLQGVGSIATAYGGSKLGGLFNSAPGGSVWDSSNPFLNQQPTDI